jgi:hypothetical protein
MTTPSTRRDPAVDVIVDALTDEITAEARHALGRVAERAGVVPGDLTPDDLAAVDIGVTVGMTAAMVVLHRHGMIEPGDLEPRLRRIAVERA